MEAAIQKNTNDELNTFKVKVEILEEELRKAIARAEHAEIELQKYRNNSNTSTNCLTTSAQTEPLIITTTTAPTSMPAPTPPPPPPPLPPPLPSKLIYKQADIGSGGDAAAAAAVTFSDSIVAHNLQKEKIIGTVKQHVHGAATGRFHTHVHTCTPLRLRICVRACMYSPPWPTSMRH